MAMVRRVALHLVLFQAGHGARGTVEASDSGVQSSSRRYTTSHLGGGCGSKSIQYMETYLRRCVCERFGRVIGI